MKDRSDKREPGMVKALSKKDDDYKMFVNGFFNPFAPKGYNFFLGYSVSCKENNRETMQVSTCVRVNRIPTIIMS